MGDGGAGVFGGWGGRSRFLEVRRGIALGKMAGWVGGKLERAVGISECLA